MPSANHKQGMNFKLNQRQQLIITFLRPRVKILRHKQAKFPKKKSCFNLLNINTLCFKVMILQGVVC